MKVLACFILCLLFFSQTFICLNVMKLDGHISLEKIKRDPLVQISITQSLIQPSTNSSQVQNFEFFLLKSVSRYKNKAYLKILKNYQKLVNILIQKLIIGDQKLLIKSKIKQKYFKRKKTWQFGIMFMMQGEQGEINQCYYDIARLGVTRMSEKPKTTTLNERIIASNSFYKLKTKLQKQLSRMPGMVIIKVQDVQISGFSIPDFVGLQSKLDEKNQQIQDSQDKEQEMSYYLDYFFSMAEIPRQSKQFTIKAVFKVGKQSQAQNQRIQFDSDQDSSSDQSQEQSQRDRRRNRRY